MTDYVPDARTEAMDLFRETLKENPQAPAEDQREYIGERPVAIPRPGITEAQRRGAFLGLAQQIVNAQAFVESLNGFESQFLEPAEEALAQSYAYLVALAAERD